MVLFSLWTSRIQRELTDDSIHRGKMEQILLAYGIPKETVAAITILYRNTKVKVRSPDGDTEYFDIVSGHPLGFLYLCRDAVGLFYSLSQLGKV